MLSQARVLGVSRVAVRQVLRSNSTAVPELRRAEKAEPYRQQILELFDRCQGNLVRVHEELVAGGAELSYPALTAFCRRHGISRAHFYNLSKNGEAPAVMRVGRRTLISAEAAAEWRIRMEAVARNA